MSDRIISTAGMLGGLIKQSDRQATRGVDLAFAAGLAPLLGVERYVPPLSCFRMVAQRSLSTPTSFLSASIDDFWQAGAPVFHSLLEVLLTDPVTGAIPPPAGADTLRFNDANRQQDRARLEGLVLIGVRSKVSVFFGWGQGLAGPPAFLPANFCSLIDETIRGWVNQFVTLGIFHTADDVVSTGIVSGAPQNVVVGEPWVDFTPLAYFDRPDGDFAAVPPLLWPSYNRDPNFQIGMRQADEAPAAAANPDWNNAFLPLLNAALPGPVPGYNLSNLTLQLSILVEALFVPPPESCAAGQWPGELCPTHKIGLHPDYDARLPVYRKAIAGGSLGPPPPGPDCQRCDDCGCEHIPVLPRPPGILDPRHNVREAVKQMLLLEDHLWHGRKVCNDCIQKHCLTIEALGEEGVTLDKANGDPGRVCSNIAKFANQLERRIQAGESKPTLAADLRQFRKGIGAALRSMLKDDGRD